MNRVVQVLLFAFFAAGIGYLSASPTYHYADPGVAVIKLSFSHAADRVVECVRLSPQEINDRALRGEALSDCERERLPLTIELDIDGRPVLSFAAAPSGLWSDGPASVYERLEVPAGEHLVTVRLRDSARDEGWDYERSGPVTLVAGRYFTITFRAETGGFGFR